MTTTKCVCVCVCMCVIQKTKTKSEFAVKINTEGGSGITNDTKWVSPCNIIKGIILNITIAISHIIWYTCATSCSAVQQLCHKFCFFKSYTCSVFVDIIRKVFILLYVICWGHSGWCCAGLHYLDNSCLYFAFKYFKGEGKISRTMMNIMHPSTTASTMTLVII